MDYTTSSSGVLETLPRFTGGRIGVYVIWRDSDLLQHHGFDDGVDLQRLSEDPFGSIAEGRRAVSAFVGGEHVRVIVTFDAAVVDSVEPFCQSLFETLIAKEQLETDMESMYSSSLALLEEVSMVGDVMSRLSTALTEQDVVSVGLEALMVAASVERAIYVRFAQKTGLCQVLVHLVMDDESRRPLPAPIVGEAQFEVTEGVIHDAIHTNNQALLSTVPEGGRLGRPDHPEHLAAREVLAVPVRCGDEGNLATLGVILVMDKRANSYSKVVMFGSQESKMTANIASMVGSALGNRLIAELDKELKLANEIQQQILPRRPAEVRGFDLAGRCEVCGQVGGDYFDFLPMADGRTLAVVADVSGHNLASGMVMVSARSTLRLLASVHDSPSRIFDGLHGNLFEDLSRTERFITAVGVALRPGDGRTEIVSAGHNDTMIFRAATRTVDRLSSRDTILGFLPNASHETTTADLAMDDVMVIYTDGVTERMTEDDEMFGEERLAEVLVREAHGSAAQILRAVYLATERFADSAEPDDDVTVVVIKRCADREEGQ